jgi:DNA-binding Lrp family transcriptional regulator
MSDKDKKAVKAYLDDLEIEKLNKIAEYFGCSASSAIRRLIRDKRIPKSKEES